MKEGRTSKQVLHNSPHARHKSQTSLLKRLSPGFVALSGEDSMNSMQNKMGEINTPPPFSHIIRM